MPKLKTKSSAKKRFKISAKGKVITPQAGKDTAWLKEQIHKLENKEVQLFYLNKMVR